MSEALFDMLGIGVHDLASITGAGGKTTLTFHLANELAAAHRRALVTTTTKMFYPSDFNATIALAETVEALVGQVGSAQLSFAAADRIDGGKVRGISPEQVDELFAAEALRDATLLNEADGAARKPYKFYAAHEPVISPGYYVARACGERGSTRDGYGRCAVPSLPAGKTGPRLRCSGMRSIVGAVCRTHLRCSRLSPRSDEARRANSATSIYPGRRSALRR